MSKTRIRSLKTAQLGMRELNLYFDGTAVAPDPLGFDRFQVTLTKLATGQYRLVLLQPAAGGLDVMGIPYIMDGDDNRIAVVDSVDYDRVTFSTRRRDDGSRADCAGVGICIKVCDARFNY